jgi:predicted amidophosphoribosyltransferase
MSYKCHKCEAQILSLRLGYCSNCREPISNEILPESKKQALAADEREYEQMRDLIRAEKDIRQQGSGVSIDIGIGDGDGWSG